MSPMRGSVTAWFAWRLLAAIGLWSPSAFAEPVHRAGEVAIESHTVVVGSATISYEIGTLYVPENRQAVQSRIIGIGFARLKAAKPGAPAIFALPGGPGTTLLDTFAAADEKAKLRLLAWVKFSEISDFVLVEQRGYTLRGEQLEMQTKAWPLSRPGSVQTDIDDTLAMATLAVAKNTGKDLAGYTVIGCAADVNDLRQALGYDRIILSGGSFGSQWSFAVMRLYPQIVARALLSGVEPLDYGYDMPSHVFAALQRIAFDGDQDPALAPYLPAGGLMAAVNAVQIRLRQAPIEVLLSNEQSHSSQTIVLGLEDFQLALVSHAENAEAWPAFVLSVYYGHYDEWARAAIDQRQAGIMTLIGPLIDTSLGVTPARKHQLLTDPAIDALGSWGFAAYLASASTWPTADVGDDFRTPRLNSTPVLFVHGDWDTSTPVENTLNMLPHFPNGRAILVHRGMHKGALALLKESPSAQAAVYAFLRTGELHDIPSAVALSMPAFARPAFEPPAPSSSADHCPD